MASRSPTLRASVGDQYHKDIEKSSLDNGYFGDHDRGDEKIHGAPDRRRASQKADPFGEEEEGDVKYRSLEWW
jgi:hypothetical protein